MLVGGEFAVAALGVDLALERVERDLPHHRVDHVLDLGGEHRLALRVSVVSASSDRKVSISPNTLAVSASVSGVGAISAPVGRRQHLVHAVAKLMRERHHVARLAQVVEQHIGVRGRHGRMRECARRLARPHRRVDPVALEEALGDRRHLRRERAIGGEHGRFALRPSRWCGSRLCGSGALRSQCSSRFLPNHFAFSA